MTREKDKNMISSTQVLRIAAGICLGLFAQLSTAADWQTYRAPSYGFSMLIPTGVTPKEQEWPGGWGGITAEFEGVKVNGQAKLGVAHTDAEIEKYSVGVIGVPAKSWRIIDSGTNQNGWTRYRVFEAVRGSALFFGAYGVGKKGNYLVYMQTTAADYNAHQAEYRKWYDSIRLD